MLGFISEATYALTMLFEHIFCIFKPEFHHGA